MLILNFSHPLTKAQQTKIEAITGQSIDEIREIPVQFETAKPFVPQLAEMLGQLSLTPEEWQTVPILLVLPALNFITAMLIAELHGKMGYFPAFVRISPVRDSVPMRYEVAEVINLQQIRDDARKTRREDKAA